MGPLEDMTVCLLKEVLDDMNLTYKTNEKKADLIEKDCHARVSLRDEYYDQSNRCHVISIIFWVPVSIWKLFHMYFHQWPNLSVLLWWTKGAPFVTPFAHIFSSGSFFNTINVDAIFLQKIISAIITIYSIASNEEFCITIIQLLQVWIAKVSSWLIVQVNFMTFLCKKISHIY